MLRFKDKTAIVTGGGRGIGKAIALALAAEGANIAVVDIALPSAEATAAEVKAMGSKALACGTDVSNGVDVQSMAKSVGEKFGRIDILVNNAGLLNIARVPFYEITEEEWDRVLAVNLKSMFLCCKAVFPYMRHLGRGKIVNMSSATYFWGAPDHIHYVSSKGGVIGFTRALSRELGDFKINANSIAPGFTSTQGMADVTAHKGAEEMVINRRSIKRREMPEDLVGAVLFLCSEDSDFITGQTLVVDGGVILN